MKKVSAFIGLGSNLGDSILNIEHAIKMIEERLGKLIAKSSFYQTKPVGFSAEQDFINAVIEIETLLAPEELMQELLNIESDLGRIRSGSKNYESRMIDLDIIAIEEQVIQSDILQLPHPRMKTRGFVLIPMAEIAPNWIHPLEKQSISQLLRRLKDVSDVVKVLD